MPTSHELNHPRRLIFRLSSLGDVILSTAALEAVAAKATVVDWVVAREYAPILRGHPAVRRLWEFDRHTGLFGWIRLCRELHAEGYDEIYDLHRTLRTTLARVLFFIWSLSALDSAPRWRSFAKQRWRMYGYFIFKKFWPRALRPRLFVQRFARCMDGTGQERPNLRHLVPLASPMDAEFERSLPPGASYVCVMPASRWAGKRWPVEHYGRLLARFRSLPVIMGTAGDEDSRRLVELLEARGIAHLSAVGKLDFPQTARVLSRSAGYLGSDTGLAHLAEAVGVAAYVLVGPTSGDLGFGPWRPASRALGSELGCRPCSKDGRACFRTKRRFACLTELQPESVLPVLDQHLVERMPQ